MVSRQQYVALALALAQTSAAELSFEAFVNRYGKLYSEVEYEMRKVVFASRVEEIEALNARPAASWTAGLNHFSDFTVAELAQRRGYAKALRDTSSSKVAGAAATGRLEIPASVDWRDHRPSIISPVKEQGSCGSCWAFSSTASIESHVALSTGKLLSLSPQQITSCTPNLRHCGGTGGCGGATAQLAFNYTVQVGLSEIWNYPYESGLSRQTGACRDLVGTTAARITGFVQVPPNDAGALLLAVGTVGPVSISVDASKWHLYKAGIFDLCNNTSPDINHLVQLVGYGVGDAGAKYWQVRNSWGTLFGEDGYIRLRRHRGVTAVEEEEPCGVDVAPQDGSGCDGGRPAVTVCGECGMLSDSSYPVGGSYGYRDLSVYV